MINPVSHPPTVGGAEMQNKRGFGGFPWRFMLGFMAINAVSAVCDLSAAMSVGLPYARRSGVFARYYQNIEVTPLCETTSNYNGRYSYIYI